MPDADPPHGRRTAFVRLVGSKRAGGSQYPHGDGAVRAVAVDPSAISGIDHLDHAFIRAWRTGRRMNRRRQRLRGSALPNLGNGATCFSITVTHQNTATLLN